MSSRFITAPYVLVTIILLLAILYGALAPGLEPLFSVFEQSPHVQDSDTVGPGHIDRITDMLFIYGPLTFIIAGIFFLYVAALRFEGMLR